MMLLKYLNILPWISDFIGLDWRATTIIATMVLCSHNTAGCSHRSGMGNEAGDTSPERMNQALVLSYRYPAIIAAESPTSCSQGRFL